MKAVMKTAEDFGVTVNLEIVNRFEHYLINTVDEGLEFVRRLTVQIVSFCLIVSI